MYDGVPSAAPVCVADLGDRTARLLGGHERERAEDGAGHGRGMAGLGEASDAEVEHLHEAVRRYVDVRRLDVAMKNAVTVRHREEVEHLVGRMEDLPEPKTATSTARKLLQRVPREELHHEEGAPLVDVVVEDEDRRRMVDLVGDVPLAHEASDELGLRGILGVEHLDGDAAAVPVSRGEDRRHPANADDRVEPPLALEHRPDALLCARKRGRSRLAHGS
jgi:hypothetical protein